MIDRFSLRIANWLDKNGANTDVDVMRYSLNVVLNTISIILICLIYGILVGNLSNAIKVMLSFALLRAVTGGVHIKSSELCIIISSSMIIGLTILSNYTDHLNYIFSISSILLLILFAPSRIEEQTNIRKKYYPLLKIISIVMVGLNFYFQSAPVAISFLVQSLTLISLKRR